MNRDASSEPSPRSYGVRELATAFFRHKKKVLFFAASTVAAATLIILFAPRSYRSEARLFLQVGRESVRLDPTATTGNTISLQQSGRQSEVASAMEVLKSRAIAEQAVDQLTPEVVLDQAGNGGQKRNSTKETILKPLRQVIALVKSIDPISKREEAIVRIQKNFSVNAEHESTIISLTYDAGTPRLAQQVMQAIVEAYRDQHARLHQTTGSKPFFAQQRDELEQQLAAAETALRDAKNRMGVGSIESRRGTIETRLGQSELVRNGVIQAIVAAQARVLALKDHVDVLPPRMHIQTRVVPNTGADVLRSQLYTLQVELMNLDAKYKADHPMVASKCAQVEEAQKLLGGEVDQREETVERINQNQQSLLLELAQAESQLAGYEAELEELDGQRSAALADLRRLNDYEVEMGELDRHATLARTNFYSYAQDLEDARVDEELNRQRITNVAVAQQATLAEKPVSPSKLIVGILSLVVLTAGTPALVLACEKLDSRVHSEDQVEQVLRLPVLASVPESRAFGAAPMRHA